MPKDFIQSDPDETMGKPVVVGTRITVERIADKLTAGESIQELLDARPRLTQQAMRAALTLRRGGRIGGTRTLSPEVPTWVPIARS
jgi:uncharacterized protein (DUF433 family)